MFRIFVILVRTTYLLTALLVLACAAPMLVSFARSLGSTAHERSIWELYEAILLVVMCLLSLCALERLLRRAAFIPDTHIRERPVIAALVLVSGAFGGLLSALVGWIALTGLPAEDVGGPLMGILIVAVASFAIALLIGELVLVGRLTRQPA